MTRVRDPNGGKDQRVLAGPYAFKKNDDIRLKRLIQTMIKQTYVQKYNMLQYSESWIIGTLFQREGMESQ